MSNWKLEKELMEVCEKAGTIKPSTIKRYVKEILNKYDDYILGIFKEKELWERIHNSENALEIFKNDKIRFKDGWIKYSEIEFIALNNDIYEVELKSGKLMYFGKNDYPYFDYLV